MMEINLDRDILNDVEKAVTYEWLEKNTLGHYAASTVIGMNTRREHGLFVVPDNDHKKHIVLLAKLEESIFADTQVHEISTNQYTSGIFPNGYNYLTAFENDPFPTFYYEVDTRRFRKTLFVLSDQPVLVVRYELMDKGRPLKLIVKPFLANRYADTLTHSTRGLNTDSYIGDGFVRWALQSDMPETVVYFNKGEFIKANLWFKNFEYRNDYRRFKEATEPLFNPGFFQVTLDAYETFELYFSLNEVHELDRGDYEGIYRGEAVDRTNKTGLYFADTPQVSVLEKTLERSVYSWNQKDILPSSLIEDNYSTRDLLFSLPGLYLIHEKFDAFKKCYLNLNESFSQGLLPVYMPELSLKNHYCSADLSLWYIQLGYLYFQFSNDVSFFSNGVLERYRDILDNYIKGTLFNIYMDKDNLIFAGNKQISAGWLPLKDEDGNVLRYGKLLEVNALWYNALRIFAFLADKTGKKRWASKYQKIADKAKDAFRKLFWVDGNLMDMVNEKGGDTTVRINRLVALALPFSPLTREETARLLAEVSGQLLTPVGCRSAAMPVKDFVHAIHRKSSVFYNGAIWPWSIVLFIQAKERHDWDEKAAQKWRAYFEPLLKLRNKGLLDHLPEVLDNEVQQTQNGIADSTMTLACILWAWYIMERPELTKPA